MEEWRPLVHANYSRYEVSNLGKVRNKMTNKELVGDLNSVGYRRVCLSADDGLTQKKFLVHKLVCESFIPKVEGKDITNHKDGNKLNNRADNLEWVTRSENDKHAYKIGKRTSNHDVSCSCNGKEYNSLKQCAKELGLNYANLVYNARKHGYYQEGEYLVIRR